jgi:hypothetical protein
MAHAESFLRNEKYYQTVVYLVFRMMGLFCQSEVQTADGRIDCVVETKQRVYCFEFKLNGTAGRKWQGAN